ncbi:hypothetical protein EVAR_75526_1 [Eumeta japonica]|uniref:Uncharacterized protein n=1 Tax=Eumeta variegata TaxID=151549 RepID=A0A4C1UKH6_EUMVA|nr:hypothetical protein EVAR_75526_1 [Eumeta japonica]
MWRRVAMRKRLCDSLLTRFDGAIYYGIHFDYIYIYISGVATPKSGLPCSYSARVPSRGGRGSAAAGRCERALISRPARAEDALRGPADDALRPFVADVKYARAVFINVH